MKKIMSLLLFSVLFLSSNAQDKVTLHLEADLVSSYLWRGLELAKFSVQPSIALGYKNLTLKGWGSVGTRDSDIKEFDLGLTYRYQRWTISVTDYYTDGSNGFFHFKGHHTNHVAAAAVNHNFGLCALEWNTNFWGNDGVNKNGKRAYSSYLSLTVPFNISGLRCKASIGATPWETNYYNNGAAGFEVTDITLTVHKDVKISSVYSLPVYGQLMINPSTESQFFAFGIKI
jgi:hypothetical protein